MLNIKKRDGSIVPFNLNKIKVAIEKAFTAVNKSYSDDIIDMLALRVTATFNDKVKGDVVSVEDIQEHRVQHLAQKTERKNAPELKNILRVRTPLSGLMVL